LWWWINTLSVSNVLLVCARFVLLLRFPLTKNRDFRGVNMVGSATIGPEIFDRTNTLVAEGKTRTEAFAQIGQERGTRPGTVAANYYRVARAQGQGRGKKRAATTRRRRSTTAAAPARRPRTRRTANTENGDIRQIAQQISDLTQQLVRRVEERDQRIRALVG
jgi:hypothetical protein